MSEIFLKIFNMSIAASWLILAIIIIRPFLKKAPKRILCLLWAIVAVKLTLPFSIESIFSLIPSSETIPPGIEFKQNPEKWPGHVGDVSTAIRVALTGRRNTPDLCEIMKVLGRDEVVARLNNFIK